MFELVSSPHYSCEVLLYVVLWLLAQRPRQLHRRALQLLCNNNSSTEGLHGSYSLSCGGGIAQLQSELMLWVLANVSLNAWETLAWYRATFTNYPKQRRVLIPWLL